MIRPSILARAIAAAALSAGCGDQASPMSLFDIEWTPSSASSGPATQVIELRGETVYASFSSETGCEFRDVVVVGSENAQVAGSSDAFGDVVLVTMDEGDHCLATSARWAGLANSGFVQSSLTSATLSTPITLTNEDTGETRSLNANFEWTATDSVAAEPGHFTDVTDDQRLVAYFSVNSRRAQVTTAELMEDGTNLLGDAQQGFVSLANSSNGSITIAYR